MVVSSAAILVMQALGNMGFTVGVGVGVTPGSSGSDTPSFRSNSPLASAACVVASTVYIPAGSVAYMREFVSGPSTPS